MADLLPAPLRSQVSAQTGMNSIFNDLLRSRKSILGNHSTLTSSPSAKADWFTLLLHHGARLEEEGGGFEGMESCSHVIIILRIHED